MDNYIWLLGGSILQKPMAEEIKRRGYKLLLTDGNPDCVCRPLADLFYPTSIYDAFECLKLAQTLAIEPSAVLTAGTDAGVEVSTIANYFELPAAPISAAKKARSKIELRLLLDRPAPRFLVVERSDDSPQWSIFPCVVKPGDASGSNGLTVVKEPDKLPAAIRRARAANKAETRVLIEEYLPGHDVLPLADYDTSEVALDFLVEDGIIHYVNGALRMFWRDAPGIEAGHFNPFTPDASMMAQAQYLADKLRLDWGPLKVDFRRTKERGWVLMEAATRLSGGFDHAFTCPLATGKDVTGAMLDMALGGRLDYNKVTAQQFKVVCCLAPYYDPGKISGWQIPEGQTVYILAGAEIKPLISNSYRPVFIVETGDSYIDALKLAHRAAKEVRPIYQ